MKQLIDFFTPDDSWMPFLTLAFAVAMFAVIFSAILELAGLIRGMWISRRRKVSVPTLHRGSPILTRMKVALFVLLLPMLGGCEGIGVPAEADQASVSKMPGALLHVIADAPPWVLWVLLIGGSIAWVATAIWADRNGENRAREATIKFRERGELTAPKQMPDVPFAVWVSEPGNRGGER